MRLISIYQCALRAQILSLKARREAARGYELNHDLQIEVRLLDAQIEVLEAELRSTRP